MLSSTGLKLQTMSDNPAESNQTYIPYLALGDFSGAVFLAGGALVFLVLKAERNNQ